MVIKIIRKDINATATDKEYIIIAKKGLVRFNRKKTIQEGAWIKLPNGKYTRATYVWDKGSVQTIDDAGTGDGGSFHLTQDGFMNYSGGLDHGFPINKLKITNRTKMGCFWVWKYAGASQGVIMQAPIRVWELKK